MKMEKAAAMLLGCSVFAASSGITSAYLMADSPSFANVITAGSVQVQLTEPAWDPESAQGLNPGDTVLKNPVVTNTGKSDAWIFLRLTVPVKHIRTVDKEGRKKKEAADTELFSFAADESWELIERTGEDGAAVYVFGYKELVSPGDSTRPLFEKVTLADYLEGELAEKELHIQIRAEAIQDHVCPPGAGLTEIYNVLTQ